MEKILIKSEKFKEKLEAFPYTESHKFNITQEYETFLKYLRIRFKLKSNEIVKIDEDDIDDCVINFLRTKPSVTAKNASRSCLNIVFEINGLDFNREKYPITNYSETNDVENKIITLEEFKNELKMLFNASDKLLCCMAFYNLLGDKLENARFAKMSDVDFINKVWKLYDGRIVGLEENEFLSNILKDTINQKEYKPFEKNENQDVIRFPDSYPYNEENVYIFKTRNHPRSENGLAPFSKVGLEICFTRISKKYGNILTRNNLKVSGFLHLMLTVDNNPNWTTARIEEFKKEVDIKISSNNARVFFLQKYFPETL